MSRRGPGAWLRAAIVTAIAFVPALSSVALRAQQRDERAVRAAYVFNLMKYVEWPAARGELRIAFLGNPADGALFESMLNGKSIESRSVRVMLRPEDEELEECSVVYFEDEKANELRKTLQRLKGRSILTIGETEGFELEGGMVGLVKQDDHIQLRVNLEATQHAGVKISSRVLNLAVIVRPAQNAGN